MGWRVDRRMGWRVNRWVNRGGSRRVWVWVWVVVVVVCWWVCRGSYWV